MSKYTEFVHIEGGNVRKISEGKLPSDKLCHVGVVIKDVDKIIQHFSSLGRGPFKPYKYPGHVTERRLRGKLVEAPLKIVTTRIG